MVTDREVEATYLAWATGITAGWLVKQGVEVHLCGDNEGNYTNELVIGVQDEKVRIRVLGLEEDSDG